MPFFERKILMSVLDYIYDKAKKNPRKVAFPEAKNEKIIVDFLYKEVCSHPCASCGKCVFG